METKENDVLVKVSGDLVEDDDFYEWLASIDNFENRLFVLCGGGTLITEDLNYHGIPFEFGPGGREIASYRGKQLAKYALEKQKNIIEAKSKLKGLEISVIMPFISVGDKLCHLNGDKYLMALYPSFDKIYVVTLKSRVKIFPEEFKKIEVIYFM